MRNRTAFLTRRRLLSGLLAPAALGVLPAAGRAEGLLARADLRGGHDADLSGLLPDAADDQSRALQRAIEEAAAQGRTLHLPAGTFVVSNIVLPDGARLSGVPGATRLVYGGRGHGLLAEGAAQISLRGLVLDGANQRLGAHVGGLLHLRGVAEASISAVRVTGSSAHGIALENSGGEVRGCQVSGAAGAGLYAVGSTGLSVRENSVTDCANGGILIHRWEKGPDGTVVSGNRVARIAARDGGTGQNGNGINVFRAAEVTIADNEIADCAFSAIRANSADNVRIAGNRALRSGETAIYAEFAFEGALITGNLVDGAAVGISVANFNEGGRLAVVSGNIVRNLVENGPYPADGAGFGIGIIVEADTSVTGNTVENAPKWGMLAGWGPYLRDVVLSGNVVREAGAGIAVSVVEGAGAALIADNILSRCAGGAVIGTRWNDVATGDLARRGAAAFPHLTVARNSVR